MIFYRNRSVQAGALVHDFLDVFDTDGFTRIENLEPDDFSFQIFYNGTILLWSLEDGAGVSDPLVSSGRVYLSEPSAGIYGVRFFPNAPGHWRLNFSYATVPQRWTTSFDVGAPNPQQSGSGLFPRFTPLILLCFANYCETLSTHRIPIFVRRGETFPLG